jgi:hypothetical protein
LRPLPCYFIEEDFQELPLTPEEFGKLQKSEEKKKIELEKKKVIQLYGLRKNVGGFILPLYFDFPMQKAGEKRQTWVERLQQQTEDKKKSQKKDSGRSQGNKENARKKSAQGSKKNGNKKNNEDKRSERESSKFRQCIKVSEDASASYCSLKFLNCEIQVKTGVKNEGESVRTMIEKWKYLIK